MAVPLSYTLLLRVQAGEARADGVEFDFAERFFDSREDTIFFQANVVVEHAAERNRLLRRKGAREGFPHIFNRRANGGMIGEHAHDFRVFVEAEVTRVPGQKHLLLFDKVRVAALIPETKQGLHLRS